MTSATPAACTGADSATETSGYPVDFPFSRVFTNNVVKKSDKWTLFYPSEETAMYDINKYIADQRLVRQRPLKPAPPCLPARGGGLAAVPVVDVRMRVQGAVVPVLVPVRETRLFEQRKVAERGRDRAVVE